MKLLNTTFVHFACRNIETILLDNQQLLYVYNHQGQYFKVFNDLQELLNFYTGVKFQMLHEFYRESDLDYFLLNHTNYIS
ncbi:hypothetical protein [Paucihalobacter sp.]|uniref:hypothetical protein n=1 Tax=Paucihalobacter sp. TaxID=2850405 RepID=UPI003D1610CC